MSDSALEFGEERGLGKVFGHVRLDSALSISDGSRARATLLLSSSGLWLIAARDRFHGLCVDILTHGDLRLLSGHLRDRLCFGQESLIIPAGRRNAVERLLALGRLGAPAGARRSELRPSRLIHPPDEIEQAWLERELGSAEVLVCWLRGENSMPLTSNILGATDSHPFLFVSERRAAIVTISRVGDVTYTALGLGALTLRMEGDQAELACNGALFASRRTDAQAARDAFELISLEQPKLRLLEAARRLWLTREHSRQEAAQTMNLLQAAISRGSSRARVARLLALVTEDKAASVDGAELSRALGEGRLSPNALTELWASWQFAASPSRVLIRGLLDIGAQSHALALQRALPLQPSADEAIARDELRLARFEVETRLAQLSDRRNLALRDVLGERGLEPSAYISLPVVNPLPEAVIEDALTHPLARGQRLVLASAQKLIAHRPEPDQGALSDYCEALDAREQPAARRALDAARLAFSIPTLHAYVSRGKKSIGLRGYEAKAPYILLGKDHIDPNSSFFMSEAELHFAIGAEALHLKLGQTRLTSHEVWAGALARTKGGVELLLGLLPLLQGIPLGASATRALEKIPEPAIRRGLEALVHLERSQRKEPVVEPASALSHVNERLIATHRVLQMSADRAGLVLCGDLRSSLRGLLLVRPDTRALLQTMAERDVASVLLDPQAVEGDPAMCADLTVRITALLEFYASEDFISLRRALVG